MSDTKGKRNVKIEIIRLIACFMVIWYHIREVVDISSKNFELKETVVFFESICSICVMTFFLITGFFIYNMKGDIISDWVKLLKKMFFNILIPFFILCIICLIFHDFIISKESFLYCLQNVDIKDIGYKLLLSIRHLDVGYLPGTAGHLWYIYSYVIIILVYPITRYILTKFPKFVTYILLLIFTILMIINDYYLFYGNPTYNIVFQIIHKPIYYSAWGYVLYNDIMKKLIDEKVKGDLNKKSLIINKPLFVISLLIYAISFIFLLKTQINYYLYHYNNGTSAPYVYTSWLSLYSLVLTSSFILIVYNINFDKILNEKVKDAIFYVSKMTLGIYLVHYLIKTKLESLGIQQQFFVDRPNILYHFAYFIVYSFIIFVLSFIVVWIIDYIKLAIKRLIIKAKNK